MRALALLLILLPAAGFAVSPQVRMEIQNDQVIEFTMTQAEQSPPSNGEDSLPSQPLAVSFTHVEPASIEHQFTLQAAIGNDGSWTDLEDIHADSEWKKLPAEQHEDAARVVLLEEKTWSFTRDDAEAPLNPSAESLRAAVRKSWGERDPNAMCKSVDEGLCYTYRAMDRFRFRGTNGKSYQLTIPQAGGC